MTERPTPEVDACLNRHWNTCSPDAVFLLTNLARRLERERDEYKVAWEQSDKACRDLTEKVLVNMRDERDALREALRELDEATNASFPAYESTAQAQAAWGDRIYNARQRARALLGEGT